MVKIDVELTEHISERCLRCISVNMLAVSGKLKKLPRNIRLNIYPDDSLWRELKRLPRNIRLNIYPDGSLWISVQT